MWYVRGLVCAFAVMLATVSFAEGEEGAVDATPNKVEELLNSKLAERIKVYLNQGLLESEPLSQYVDREYWDSIRDDFAARVSTIISEDAFIQVILPILDSVKAELQELVKLTLQELVVRGDECCYEGACGYGAVAPEVSTGDRARHHQDQGSWRRANQRNTARCSIKLGRSLSGQTASNICAGDDLASGDVVLLALSMEIISHASLHTTTRSS